MEPSPPHARWLDPSRIPGAWQLRFGPKFGRDNRGDIMRISKTSLREILHPHTSSPYPYIYIILYIYMHMLHMHTDSYKYVQYNEYISWDISYLNLMIWDICAMIYIYILIWLMVIHPIVGLQIYWASFSLSLIAISQRWAYNSL